MVMSIEQIQASTAHRLKMAGRTQASEPRGISIAHTGQEVRSPSAVTASILLRERLVSSRLEERRRLRVAQLQRQSELSMSFAIDVDAQLLTGNLDQDISILDIVA